MAKLNESDTAENFVYDPDSTVGKYEKAITDPSVGRITVEQLKRSAAEIDGKAIESAVYAHIRAVRALGRATINSAEIAEALSIPLEKVHNALVALKAKGVRAL